MMLCASVQVADARPRPRAKKFSANKNFGLGLMLGAPTGLSGKYYLSADTALDFGVGVFRRWRERDGTAFHVDLLWHPAVLINARPFVIPLYFGIGARVFDYNDDVYDDFALGLRLPVGVMLDFNRTPLDIFFEAAFVFDFYDDSRGREADLNGAVGVRYYF